MIWHVKQFCSLFRVGKYHLENIRTHPPQKNINSSICPKTYLCWITLSSLVILILHLRPFHGGQMAVYCSYICSIVSAENDFQQRTLEFWPMFCHVNPSSFYENTFFHWELSEVYFSQGYIEILIVPALPAQASTRILIWHISNFPLCWFLFICCVLLAVICWHSRGDRFVCFIRCFAHSVFACAFYVLCCSMMSFSVVRFILSMCPYCMFHLCLYMLRITLWSAPFCGSCFRFPFSVFQWSLVNDAVSVLYVAFVLVRSRCLFIRFMFSAVRVLKCIGRILFSDARWMLCASCFRIHPDPPKSTQIHPVKDMGA